MQKTLLFLLLLITGPAISQSQQVATALSQYARWLGSARANMPLPQRCPAPRDYGWWQSYERGEKYFTPTLGPSSVEEPILSIWAGTGKTQGRLGFPLKSTRRDQAGRSETIDIQDFEGGTISFNHVTRQTNITYNDQMLGPGRYRLVLCGFKVEQETTDNPFETDGKGDEVYIRTDAFITDKHGRTTNAPSYQTKVFGDINGQENRIKAGSRSEKGGLKTGDMFPSATPWVVGVLPPSIAGNGNQLPMKIWEGDIDDGNYLFIIPTLWEVDDVRPGEVENNWPGIVSNTMNLPPYRYEQLNLTYDLPKSVGAIDGNLPFGRGGASSNTHDFVTPRTPVIIANLQGFYFGHLYRETRPVQEKPHGPDIFEALFRNSYPPFGTYRLYLKWEKLSVKTNPTNYSGIIK